MALSGSHGSLSDLAGAMNESTTRLSLVDTSLAPETLIPLGEPAVPEAATPSLSVPSSHEASDRALLGLGSGFNVMDFLDNILDETQHSPEDSSTVVASGGLGEALSDHQSVESAESLIATPVLSISSDPWANVPQSGEDRISSRAAAYGIAVEAGDEGNYGGASIVQAFLASPDRRSDHASSDAVPLLTPEAVMHVGTAFVQDYESEGEGGGEEEEDVYNEKSSFFGS